MAIYAIRTTTILLLCLCLCLLTPSLSSDSTVSELSALQSKSPTGVIHLTDDLLLRILSLPAPRPFHFLVFFDARKLHPNPELSLPALKSEFSIVSSSFYSNHPDNKSLLFFFNIEFQESQASFALFGIQSLPNIRLIPSNATSLKTDSIQMEVLHPSKLAESMAEFIASRTKLTVGPINRPPLISTKQVILLAAAGLIWSAFFIKKLISGNTIFHQKGMWMAGAILVYFFSVSGMMFNIIRKMPLFLVDRKDPNKFLFFYRGSGLQLGAEGIAVGFLYTIVGLLLAFMTHVLVIVKNRIHQRLIMICLLFVLFWSIRKVILLDNWKTGYRVHAYWPSSWR